MTDFLYFLAALFSVFGLLRLAERIERRRLKPIPLSSARRGRP